MVIVTFGSAEAVRHPLNPGCVRYFYSLSCQDISKTLVLRLGEVETVKVHDLAPYCYKVVQELLLGVFTSVDFPQGPELGI